MRSLLFALALVLTMAFAAPAQASVSIDTDAIIGLAQDLLTDALNSTEAQSENAPVTQSSDAGEIVCDTYSILNQAGLLDVPGSCSGTSGGDNGGGNGGGEDSGGGSGGDGGDSGGGNDGSDDGSSGGGNPGGGSSGGSSGGNASPSSAGGGTSLQTLVISGEEVVAEEQGVRVTWETNVAATGWVVYGTTSVPTIGGTADGFVSPKYTYGYYTEASTEARWWHTVVLPIDGETVWYVRPVASASGMFAFGKEHMVTVQTSTSTDASSAPATEQCLPYLQTFIKRGGANDAEEVRKLQDFFRTVEGIELEITGEYDTPSINAVEAFQRKYAAEVLAPWGAGLPTGHVYITTRKKVNELYCQNRAQFPLSDDQLAEIERFRLGTAIPAPLSVSIPVSPSVQETPTIDSPVGVGGEVAAQLAGASAAVGNEDAPVRNRVFIKNIREHIGGLFERARSVLPGFGE